MAYSSPQLSGLSSSELSSLPGYFDIANRRFALQEVVLQPSPCGEFIWVFATGGAQRCFGRPKVSDLPRFIEELNADAVARREETLARLASAARGEPVPNNLGIEL